MSPGPAIRPISRCRTRSTTFFASFSARRQTDRSTSWLIFASSHICPIHVSTKATIAARFSGATIEIVGAKPPELPDWLWDYDARPLTDADKTELAHLKRTARTGFSGGLYKTDAFLAANPFGAVPAAFGGDGAVGLFESNSIMRAAARLGPNAESIYGGGPLMPSRIDSFLDRNLVFARDLQRYLLGGRAMTDELYGAMENEAHAYFTGIEQAL